MTLRGWAVALLFAAALAATVATHLAVYQQTDFFQQWFFVLLVVDAALVGLLLVVVGAMVARLVLSWRRGERGARLSLRITLLFWGVSLLPAVLLYTVSVGAVFRGIESWFDIPLGQSFERGIAFGQDVVGKEFDRLEYVARDIAERLPARPGLLTFYLNDALLLHRLDGIALYDRRGNVLAGTGDGVDGDVSAAFVGRVQREGLHLSLKGSGVDRVTEVIVPVAARRNAALLLIARALPPDISEGLAEIERGQREYEKLLVLRDGLRWSFILTMSLALALILFALGWLSLRLGRNLTRPFVQLSAAAEAVGGGDFKRRLRDEHPLEEVAQLNRSFNVMVGDLQRSQHEIAERQTALTTANAYLENLLSSLTTGVLTFDAAGVFTGCNEAAARFFGQPLSPLVGGTRLPASPLTEAYQAAARALTDDEEDSAETRVVMPDGGVLLLRVLSLPASAGGGVLMMVDDISRQIRAEREATWEEASRRFVHEIKNPLTPIQLAAERLQSKLAGRLSGEDELMLQRLVRMIVNQVGAMRQMVDSFRHYADRRSAPPMQPLALNELLTDVLYFYENRRARLNVALGEALPPVQGNAVTLRQLLHNVLGNAMDAIAAAEEVSDPAIDIATVAAGSYVELRVEDNAGGVPADMLKRLCEPYVTSKQHGSGLGLAIVRKTVDEHNGDLRLENGARGLRVIVRLPAA